MHTEYDPEAAPAHLIAFEDFLRVDIRLGEILEVQDFPEAKKPSYKLVIDFGPGVGIKKSSAQITAHYESSTLVGRRILAVVNFPPRQIGKFMSEVLVLGISDQNGDVVLLSPDREAPLGGRLH